MMKADRFVDPFDLPSIEERIMIALVRDQPQWKKGGRRRKRCWHADVCVGSPLPCGCRGAIVIPTAPWSACDPHPTMQPYWMPVAPTRIYCDGGCMHLGCGKSIARLGSFIRGT